MNEELNKKASLYAVYLKQDDPKKNTIIKLSKFNLIKIRKDIRQCPKNAIILDPFSKIILGESDQDQIKNNGIIVIDCSWARTESIFQDSFQNGRALPNFLAGNPINYGKWNRLSSAEALAAALYLTGFIEQGRLLLSKFKWGKNFWNLNSINIE